MGKVAMVAQSYGESDSEDDMMGMERNATHDRGSMTNLKQPFQQTVGMMMKHAEKTLVRQLVVYLTPRQGFGI